MPGEIVGGVIEVLIRGLLRLVGAIIETLLEGFVQVVCYFTARWLLPVLTLGRVQVEPALPGVRLKLRWHGCHRAVDGTRGLDAELGTLIGLLMWVAAPVAGGVLYAIL